MVVTASPSISNVCKEEEESESENEAQAEAENEAQAEAENEVVTEAVADEESDVEQEEEMADGKADGDQPSQLSEDQQRRSRGDKRTDYSEDVNGQDPIVSGNDERVNVVVVEDHGHGDLFEKDEEEGRGDDEDETVSDEDDYEDEDENSDEDGYYSHNDDSSSQLNPSGMPLFHYRRVGGGGGGMLLPLSSQSSCITASALGRVVLNSETTPAEMDASSSASASMANNYSMNPMSSHSQSHHLPASSSSSYSSTTATAATTSKEPTSGSLTRSWFHSGLELVAYGFDSGQVMVTDAAAAAATAASSSNNSSFSIGSTTATFPAVRAQVVALSWDATATHLGVLDQERMVTVYADLKYAIQMKDIPIAASNAGQPTSTSMPSSSSSSVATPQHVTDATSADSSTNPANDGVSSSDPPPPPSSPPPKRSNNPFSNFMFAAWTGRSSSATTTATTIAPPSRTHSGNVEPDIESSATATTTTTTATTTPSSTTTPPSTASSPTASPTRVPMLVVITSQMQTHRISYPASFGIPTCLALDPAYRKRQHVVVGFADGRLVYTRRGFFQRRQDTVLYQGTSGPIQAVTWRGSLLAVADPTGIRLLDVDTLTRIAHIDRPAGALPSLYPTIAQLRPVWTWETTSTLLVAWGDSLLSLTVHETTAMSHSQPTQSAAANAISEPSLLPDPMSTIATAATAAGLPTRTATSLMEATPLVSTTSSSSSSASSSLQQQQHNINNTSGSNYNYNNNPNNNNSNNNNNNGSGTTAARRRSVECTMAWQLDCVACGVAPLDAHHVAVLGIVPPPDPDDDLLQEQAEEERDQNENSNHNHINNNNGEDTKSPLENDVELQVVSRLTGEVICSDWIPILRNKSHTSARGNEGGVVQDVASSMHLLSSFALVRETMTGSDSSAITEEELGGPDVMSPAPVMSSVSLFSMDASPPLTKFVDSHLRWNLSMVAYHHGGDDNEKIIINHNISHSAAILGTTTDICCDHEDDSDDDSRSEDSDDYGRIFQLSALDKTKIGTAQIGDVQAVPPMMMVVTALDAVHVRVRTIDDAISWALSEKKAGLALYRGLTHRRQLREYDLRDLIHLWFQAVLRLPSISEDSDGIVQLPKNPSNTTTNDAPVVPHLSLRRMKLAAEAMPILLGGDARLWITWIIAMQQIPGALFIARYSFPVRDPVLPKRIYASVLGSMLEQIDQMPLSSTDQSIVERLVAEAEGHLLNTLLGWGSIALLRDYIKLYRQQSAYDTSFLAPMNALEESLVRRRNQSSACYLQFVRSEQAYASAAQAAATTTNSFIEASLYDVDEMLGIVSKRLGTITKAPGPLVSKAPTKLTTDPLINTRVTLEAASMLHMMRGNFDEALRHLLFIGLHHPVKSLEEIENEAVRQVNIASTTMNLDQRSASHRRETKYSYVLRVIENHHLHQCLLNERFLYQEDDMPPLFALVRVVGLNLLGEFLIAYCTAPQQNEGVASKAKQARASVAAERRGTLPLDLVAQQLQGSPKLLYWYLHSVFVLKPSVYVVFPDTAVPPRIISLLHRKHLDLCIRFADTNRDSSKVFAGVEAYRVTEQSTPLLSFLKVALQLGGIQPMEIAKLLQAERSKSGSAAVLVSPVFSLELAYILEHFGDVGAEEARLILELYLQGCHSLMLAVSYAQRAAGHSTELWEILIEFCLNEKPASPTFIKMTGTTKPTRIDGSLFGSLLEAAALSGADLAKLVQTIPPGMAIEGLRPRLVAAVADYRFKVQLRQSAAEIAGLERQLLIRELEYRCRRGVRYNPPPSTTSSSRVSCHGVNDSSHPPESLSSQPMPQSTIPITQLKRITPRPDRIQISYALSIR